jgi:hypothetical protein
VCERQDVYAKVIRAIEDQADIRDATESIAGGLEFWEILVVEIQVGVFGAW